MKTRDALTLWFTANTSNQKTDVAIIFVLKVVYGLLEDIVFFLDHGPYAGYAEALDNARVALAQITLSKIKEDKK
jgi:hypothetical protein